MAKIVEEISTDLKEFIARQKVFFVGTAAQTGTVNISPKGMDTFRVVDSKKIVWLNLTGSGNETAAHLVKNNRMTIMFCAFEGKPLILRLYGQSNIFHHDDKEFMQYINLFPTISGSRQIIEMHIDKVQTSCGFAVPLMDFKEERTMLQSWSDKQGKGRIEAYWKEKNAVSIDGFETPFYKSK